MAGLPPLNKRIRDLMRAKTGKESRNVSMFAQMISKGREKPIVQQRLDKIFDEKNPSTVAVDIVEAIILRFPEVDAHKLITGKEKSDSYKLPDINLLTQLKQQIDQLLSLHKLSTSEEVPNEENVNQGAAYQGFEEDKSLKSDKR